MRLRTWIVVGIAGLLLSVVILQARLIAQRPFNGPAVISPHGFIVEEVKVGESCVVIVSQGGGSPSRAFAAVPCRP